MSYWAVCQCQSRREQAVVDRLHRIGYVTYLPKLIDRGKLTAFFPGYLFVQIENVFYPARWTQGVIGLRMTCDQQSLETVMGGLQKIERNGVVPQKKVKTFLEGQRLRVTVGSFAGHVGEVAAMRGEERSVILLQLLGQQVKVEMPNRDLSPI